MYIEKQKFEYKHSTFPAELLREVSDSHCTRVRRDSILPTDYLGVLHAFILEREEN